jgi:Tol biopolymer transport system component
MTTFDRFDPFERRIGEALEGIAPQRPLDYLDDVLRQTARTAQRPRWSFPERWFNVDIAVPRSAFGGRLPFRTLLILAVVAALLAASLALYIGTHKRLPLAFGPAANGDLIFSRGGDIFVRNGLTGPEHLLIGAAGDQFAASYSPDGQLISYASASAEGDHFMVANADGTNPRQLALIPSTGNAQGAWAPDSKRAAFIYDVNGVPRLSIVTMAGETAVIDLGELVPLDVAFEPPNGDRLLIRAHEPGGDRVGLYTMGLDGSDRHTLVPPLATTYGTQFTRSGAVWSPDGRTVAYNGIDPVTGADGEVTTRFRLHLVNADGTNDRAVQGPADPAVEENWASYSPDGAWILVQRWTSTDSTPGTSGWIAIMPSDGSAPAHDIGPRFEDSADTAITKSWSPDGTRLLMFVGSKQQTYSVDPISGDFELLPWAPGLPDWQRRAMP